MNASQLLPRYRREAIKRRRARRGWLIAVGVYTLIAGAGVLVLRSTAMPQRAAAARLSELDASAQAARDELAALSSQSLELARRVSAIDQIDGHPDIGVLLRLVAAESRGEAVLETISITPILPTPSATPARPATAARPGTKPAPNAPIGYDVTLTGLTRSAAAAGAFVLRLEQSGIFSKVTLMHAEQAVDRGPSLNRFTLKGRLDVAETKEKVTP